MISVKICTVLLCLVLFWLLILPIYMGQDMKVWLSCQLVLLSNLLVLILMHWQQGSDIELKGDKLSSSVECRIWTQGLWNQIFSRLRACLQTYWVIDNQAKYMTSVARPFDQMIAKPGNKIATPLWPKPYAVVEFPWSIHPYSSGLFVMPMIQHRNK